MYDINKSTNIKCFIMHLKNSIKDIYNIYKFKKLRYVLYIIKFTHLLV